MVTRPQPASSAGSPIRELPARDGWELVVLVVLATIVMVHCTGAPASVPAAAGRGGRRSVRLPHGRPDLSIGEPWAPAWILIADNRSLGHATSSRAATGSTVALEQRVRIAGIDHLVLTVADVDRTLDWYVRVLGMNPITFGGGRPALAFGHEKLNLHRAGEEIEPHAVRPTPGSVDLCLVSATGLSAVTKHLSSQGVRIELGPVGRSGAVGPITSVYVRDPDGNLVEICTYDG